ncbi:MAG: metal ABC transporter permease, partial [Chlamydiia bacterium]|nr:metal ABC transporter permease [Chlamydiia bacterium]
MSLVEYFTDPVLRAPTIGSLLMCLSASLVGVIVFLRRQSLIGEVLSHASYPGVILGITLIGSLSIDPEQQLITLTIVLFCASLTAWLGLKMIHWMTYRLKIRQDASLCFTLSTFFGVGLCLASEIQFAYPSFYKQVLSFLFGQVATMTEIHVMAYTLLAVVVCGVIFSFYKELKVTLFDRHLAKSLGLNVGLIDEIVTILIVIAVVAGIRSVGVVLMAAMLIAPAIAARQYTHSLSTLFILSGIFGLISGFGGTYLSFEFSMYWGSALNQLFSFPSGPMIVLTASL